MIKGIPVSLRRIFRGMTHGLQSTMNNFCKCLKLFETISTFEFSYYLHGYICLVYNSIHMSEWGKKVSKPFFFLQIHVHQIV